MRRIWQGQFVFALVAVVASCFSASAATIDVTGTTSTAINSAIGSASSGDIVYLPAGTYSISSSINAKSGVTITGAGENSTILNYTGTSLNPIFSISGATGAAISNLTASGNNNADAMDGVIASNSTNLSITGIDFQNFVNTSNFGPFGVYCSTAVTNSTVANCTFSNIGVGTTYGGGIRFSSGSSYDTAINNSISNTGRGGIFGDDGGVGEPSTNLTIENNTVTGSGGTGLGIEVQDCADALIQGNHVDHWISVDTSSGSAVRNNVVSDTSGVYKFTGLELVNSNGVVFSGNTVNGGAQIGISESNSVTGQSSSMDYFANNTIESPSTWGIQIQGGTGGITQQYFFGNKFLAAQGANANQFASPAGIGFRFNANAQDIVLNGNTISNNGNAGIYLNGSSLNALAFLNNTITNNSGPDVTLQGGANPTDLEWSDNTLGGNTSNSGLTATRSPSADPTLSVGLPADFTPGDTLSFSLNFDPTGAALADVLWDFDDGLPLLTTSTTATHTFTAAGIYTVGVVAWDTDGRAAQEQFTINITPSEVPEPVGMITVLSSLLILTRRRSHRI